jgi:hypothetical protein
MVGGLMGWTGVNPADWSDKQQKHLLAVFRRALVLLGRELIRTKSDGGSLPKVTGNLARSLLAQIGQSVNISEASDFAGTDVGIIAATAILGDTVFFGYQAKYARRQNFGFVGADKLGRVYNHGGNHFVERAIAMWPQIVDQAVREVKAGATD